MLRRRFAVLVATLSLAAAALVTTQARAAGSAVVPDLFALQPAYGYPNTTTNVVGKLCASSPASCAPAGEIVYVQLAEVGSSVWTTTATVGTGADGSFRAALVFTHDMQVRAVYLGGLQFTGSVTAPVLANMHLQNLAPQILFSPTGTAPSYPVGSDILMAGAFAVPSGATIPAGSQVLLQAEPAYSSPDPYGAWTTYGTAALEASGYFSGVFQLPAAGEYWVRGYFPGNEDLWPAGVPSAFNHQWVVAVAPPGPTPVPAPTVTTTPAPAPVPTVTTAPAPAPVPTVTTAPAPVPTVTSTPAVPMGLPLLTAQRSPSGTVVINQPVTVTGTLSTTPATGTAARTVALRFRAAGATTSRALATSGVDAATGAFRFTAPVPASGQLSVSFAGSATEEAAMALLPVTAVKGSPRLTMLRIPPRAVVRGTVIRFSAKLSRTWATPATTPRPVTLRFRPTGSTTWVRVTTTYARLGDGYLAFAWRASRSGTWKVSFAGSRTENPVTYARTVAVG